MDERELIVSAVARVLSGERAVDVVPGVLRTHPALDDAGRARISSTIYACCVERAHLAFLAHLADPFALSAADAAALVDVKLGGAPARALPGDPLERLCIERSCPRWLAEELIESLGLDGADAFLAASNRPGPRVLRANVPLRADDRAAVASALRRVDGIETSPGALAPHALVVEGRANLFGCYSWRRGLFEVQDESSQLAIAACGARPGDVVVDLCAGRGGKALGLACEMRGAGVLWVHDVDERALVALEGRARRLQLRNIRRGLPAVDAGADIVLVDAPCSSLGPLRRSPDLRWTLTRDALESLPALQLSLIERAARLVKPGGRVVYATCTVRRAENGDVVGAACARLPLEIEEQRTLLPHVEGCDGFFIATLRRRERAQD